MSEIMSVDTAKSANAHSFTAWALGKLTTELTLKLQAIFETDKVDFVVWTDKPHWLGRVSVKAAFEFAAKESHRTPDAVSAIYATRLGNKAAFEAYSETPNLPPGALTAVYWMGDFSLKGGAWDEREGWLWHYVVYKKLPE